MAFDPDLDTNQTESHLRHIFKGSVRPDRYRVPGSLEPELKYILPDNNLSTFRRFYSHLQNSNTVFLLPKLHTDKNMLISLREDTIDPARGIATREIEKAGLMRRRRADFNLSDLNTPFSQFDESAKDLLPAAKTTALGLRLRREFEAHAFGRGLHFTSGDLGNVMDKGYEAFTQIHNLPDVLKNTPQDHLRVSSALITSRASYHFIHAMPDLNAAMSYEACSDCCLITSPHGDIRVAKRTEQEVELKDIYFAGDALTDEGIESLIVESMHRMDDIVKASGLYLIASEESKMEQADREVAAFYTRNGMTASSGDLADTAIQMHGIDYSLLQNVTSEQFLQNTSQLSRIASALPRPNQILAIGGNERSCARRNKAWLNLPDALRPHPALVLA